MNCNEIQQKLLLADAGELDARAMSRLDDHINACDSCRSYSDDLATIMPAARDALCSDGPGRRTLAAVNEAAREAATPAPLLFQLPAWSVRTLAYAAVFLLLIGGWIFVAPGNDTERIRDVRAVLASLTDEDTVNGAERSREEELETLAEDLLRMQGFLAEETQDLLYLEPAPQPTALQSRNTHAPA